MVRYLFIYLVRCFDVEVVDPPQVGDVSIYLVGRFDVEMVDPPQGGDVGAFIWLGVLMWR